MIENFVEWYVDGMCSLFACTVLRSASKETQLVFSLIWTIIVFPLIVLGTVIGLIVHVV